MAKNIIPVQEIGKVKRSRFFNLQLFADDGDPPPAKGGGYSAAYVQDLRDEAANWRKKLRKAEEERDDYKTQMEAANKKVIDLEGQNKTFLESVCKVLELDASKVKPEEVVAKIKEATSQSSVTVEKAQEALRKAAFMASAVKQGIRKEALEDAYKLADFSAVKVDLESMTVYETDKDGKQVVGKDNNPVTGLDSLVEGMAKEKSWLLGKTSSGIGGSSNPGGEGEPPGEPEGFGSKLGKKQKEQSKKSNESQNLYFPS